MADGGPYRYTITTTGDFVEAVIGKLTKEQAGFWRGQGADKVFRQTFMLAEDEDDPEFGDDHRLPNWRDFPDATHLEGTELRNGVIEVTDEFGNDIYNDSLETDAFWGRHADASIAYDDNSDFGVGRPCHVGITLGSGDTAYSINSESEFNPDLLMIHVTSGSRLTVESD